MEPTKDLIDAAVAMQQAGSMILGAMVLGCVVTLVFTIIDTVREARRHANAMRLKPRYHSGHNRR